MISVRFQGKPFNIIVIHVYGPTTNAEEAERFCEDLQDLLELTPKKGHPQKCPFHYSGLECKSRKSSNTWKTGKFGLGIQNEAPAAAAAAKSLQWCPTLCDLRDGSPPGSPTAGILQARTLEWISKRTKLI